MSNDIAGVFGSQRGAGEAQRPGRSRQPVGPRAIRPSALTGGLPSRVRPRSLRHSTRFVSCDRARTAAAPAPGGRWASAWSPSVDAAMTRSRRLASASVKRGVGPADGSQTARPNLTAGVCSTAMAWRRDRVRDRARRGSAPSMPAATSSRAASDTSRDCEHAGSAGEQAGSRQMPPARFERGRPAPRPPEHRSNPRPLPRPLRAAPGA